jgi:glyoxylase-like metal-dependent hydrolase (beta-lactamase superfamily II)
MDFLELAAGDVVYGAVTEVAPLVRRVIAENPSKFTYRGTGTYIVGSGDVAVVDPGPDLDSHRDALASALSGERVRAILVTHCHADHSPLAAWLAAESGASTFAFGPHPQPLWEVGPDDDIVDGDPDDDAGDTGGARVEESVDTAFTPDVVTRTGDVVMHGRGWTMTALHTPGHTSNHTSFVLDDGAATTLFTGDHVMGWSTTVVAPPDGDMAAYIESLRVVAGRHDAVAIPTHGPPIPEPAGYVDALIAHRLERERQVLDAVRSGLATVPAIVAALYTSTPKRLHKAAGRSVLAHLVKLVDEGAVTVADPRPRLDSTFS